VSFRANKTAVARLVVIALYAVVLIAAGFGHWSHPVNVVAYIGIAILWLVLLVIFVVELRQSETPWAFIRLNPAIPLLLASPAFLILDWDAVWFLMVIVAYIFELRRHSPGDGLTFSFALIAFVGILAALTMVELENDNPQSEFRNPSDALYWAFGDLLRINTGRSYTPTTEDGQHLATVVAVCGVIAASMFTARLVTWVVGERKSAEVKQPADPSSDDVRARLAALESEVDRLTAGAQDHGRPGDSPGG